MKTHRSNTRLFHSPQDGSTGTDLRGIIVNKEIYQTAFRIAWPSTLEAVLVGLVGVIDTIMVSALGSGAIAAVGLTNQPKMIVLATIMSLNVSVTAIVARRKGAMERLDANRCLRFRCCSVL